MDLDNGLIPMMPSQDGIPPPDPLRLDWPKVVKNILLIACLKLLIFLHILPKNPPSV